MKNKKKLFLNKINANEKKYIQILVNKLKRKEIKIEDITENQRKKICIFLKKEILRKKEELKQKKNQILLNKIRKSNNRNNILKRISYDDKKNFIEYLNKFNLEHKS